MDVRTGIVHKHDVSGGVDPPRKRREWNVYDRFDSLALVVSETAADEQPVLVACSQRADGGRATERRSDNIDFQLIFE